MVDKDDNFRQLVAQAVEAAEAYGYTQGTAEEAYADANDAVHIEIGGLLYSGSWSDEAAGQARTAARFARQKAQAAGELRAKAAAATTAALREFNHAMNRLPETNGLEIPCVDLDALDFEIDLADVSEYHERGSGLLRRLVAGLQSLHTRRDGNTSHHITRTGRTTWNVTAWSYEGAWGSRPWHATATIEIAVDGHGEVRLRAKDAILAVGSGSRDEVTACTGAVVERAICRWLLDYYGRAGVRRGVHDLWLESQPQPHSITEWLAVLNRDSAKMVTFTKDTTLPPLRDHDPADADTITPSTGAVADVELEDWERELIEGPGE